MRRSNLLLAMLGLITLMASLWVWVAVDPSAADAGPANPIEAPDDADASLPPAFARDAEPIAPDDGSPTAADAGTDGLAPNLAPGVDRADLSALAVLTGRVTRAADGKPVPGLTLEPTFSSTDIVAGMSRATTDADGHYRFALAEDCTLIVLGVPPTGDTTRRRVRDQVTLRLGETATLDVALTPGATLVGLVVDGDTRPVPGATVLGWTDRSWAVDNRPERTASPDRRVVADALGRFTISGLGPRYLLSAEAPGMICRWRLHGTVQDGLLVEGVTLQMSASRHAPGRVLGPLELPLRDVRVQARDARVGSQNDVTGIEGVFRIGPAPASTTTDGSGRFLLGPLADIPYDVDVEHARHPSWRGTNAPGDPEMLIRLARGASLSGRLVSALGGPVPGAQLQLASTDGAGALEETARVTRSDDDGFFELLGLSADDHALLAVLADDHAVRVEHPIVLAEDETHELDIVLDGERALAGVVVDVDGAPIAGALVEITGDRILDYGGLTMSAVPTWESRFSGLGRTRTDEQGAFRLGRLYDGMFAIEVEHPDDELLIAKLSARSGSEDLTVVLDPDVNSGVTLLGQVRDALTGLPVESFSITPMIPKGVGGMTGESRQFDNADGTFRVTGLEPGVMMINAGAKGYAPWSRSSQEYTAGEHLLDVQLLATRTLHVRVLDRAWDPVPKASLTFLDRDMRELFVASGMSSGTTRLTTDANGEAIAMRLPADHMTVRVSRGFLGGKQDFIFDLRDEPVGVQELILGEPEEVPLLVVLLTGEEPVAARDPGADAEELLTAARQALEAGTAKPLDGVARIEATNALGQVVAEREFDPGAPDPTIKLSVPGVDHGFMLMLPLPGEPLELTVTASGYVTERLAWQPDRSVPGAQVRVIFLRPE